MNADWSIQSRGDRCSVTGREFAEDETFYTLLFRDKAGFRREDLCEEAYRARNDNIQPFSTWKTKFVPPAPPAPEPLAKETAEDLLRRLMAEEDRAHTNARYLLAVMLERKRVLRQREVSATAGGRTLVYEHAKTGEVFVVPDPSLRLDQLAEVQAEIAALLGDA